jgi:hypothetical protein
MRLPTNTLIQATYSVAIALLLALGTLEAHHSFAAEFDINQPVSLRGTLTKMEWVNPHGWIYLDVTGNDGTVVNWAIETGSVVGLQRRGLRKTDFPLGAVILVQGYRAKNGKPIANGAKVTFANGRDFSLGSSSEPGR